MTVAPVRGGDVDEGSSFLCDDVLDGTLKRDPFFCAFSGTAKADSATFSFVDEAEGPSLGDVWRAESEVVARGGDFSAHEISKRRSICQLAQQ